MSCSSFSDTDSRRTCRACSVYKNFSNDDDQVVLVLAAVIVAAVLVAVVLAGTLHLISLDAPLDAQYLHRAIQLSQPPRADHRPSPRSTGRRWKCQIDRDAIKVGDGPLALALPARLVQQVGENLPSSQPGFCVSLSCDSPLTEAQGASEDTHPCCLTRRR